MIAIAPPHEHVICLGCQGCQGCETCTCVPLPSKPPGAIVEQMISFMMPRGMAEDINAFCELYDKQGEKNRELKKSALLSIGAYLHASIWPQIRGKL